MGLTLTTDQKKFLGNTEQVKVLARWVIASERNRYARELCTKAKVTQSNSPSQRQIDVVSEYLRDDRSDASIVARLINLYRAHNRQQP